MSNTLVVFLTLGVAAGGHGGVRGRVDVGVGDSPVELSLSCCSLY